MIYFIRESNGLVGFRYNDETYYYIKNAQEDILGIIDELNNLIASYEYDSWGAITSITDDQDNDVSNDPTHIANINPFRYRSYYYDVETGLYYLNSRYYNPEWGRFINCDIGVDTEHLLGTNLYQYGYNNPVNTIDSDGTWPKWLKTVAIVTVAVVAVAAITLVTAGTGTAAAVIAAGVLKGAATGAAIGAVGGAIGGAVSHTLSTGSTKGAGQAAVKGAVTGAVTGAAGGAVLGGVSSAIQVGQAANAWGATMERTSLQNLTHHFNKHVIGDGHSYLGKNIVQYTNNAKGFYGANQGLIQWTSSGNNVIRGMYAGQKAGGFFSQSGKILSFFH